MTRCPPNTACSPKRSAFLTTSASVTYRLRANARWHDGKPVTPEDVIFSFHAFKDNSPQLGAYYRHVTKAEKTGEREITFTFDGPGNRELPQIVGQLPVLPKHWWEGDRQERQQARHHRDHAGAAARLRALPREGNSRPAAPSSTSRSTDYWGKDLKVHVGTNNFQTIRYEYFRDSTVALEAFKGDQVDWRSENSARDWATAYDFPAVREKRVVREEFPVRNLGIMQSFVFNLRRDKFKDPRVRRAFNLAFDFDDMNKQLFYRPVQAHRQLFLRHRTGRRAACRRARSWRSSRTVKDQVPAEVFTTPTATRQGGDQRPAQQPARRAEAVSPRPATRSRTHQLVNAKTGEQFTVEFLIGRADLRARRPLLQAVAGTARHRRHGAHGRHRRNTRTGCGSRDFDIIVSVVGPVAVAGQRAARLLGIAGGRPAPARAISSASRTRRSTN